MGADIGIAEVEEWYDAIWQRAESLAITVEILEDTPTYQQQMKVYHSTGNRYVRFRCVDGSSFFGYWQPAQGGGPAPLLIHLPGYDAPISAFPSLVAEGYNVLDMNPLGYMTPEGVDAGKLDPDVEWGFPVLLDTARTLGKDGYTLWLAQAYAAVGWALGQAAVLPSRIGIFGTSQGGAMSMLLGGVLKSRGLGLKAIASDVPAFCGMSGFLSGSDNDRIIEMGDLGRYCAKDDDDFTKAIKAMRLLDPLVHAPMLALPVLLVAGTDDVLCPPVGIQAVFEALPATRSYTVLSGQQHGPTVPFLYLATAWFRTWV